MAPRHEDSDELHESTCYCTKCGGGTSRHTTSPEKINRKANQDELEPELPPIPVPVMSERTKKFIEKYPSLKVDFEEFKLKYDHPESGNTTEAERDGDDGSSSDGADGNL